MAGRHPPYLGYLGRDLTAYSLHAFPLSGNELLDIFRAILDHADAVSQQRLLAVIAEQCRAAGHGDVIDAWGDAWTWMTSFPLPTSLSTHHSAGM